MRHIAALVVLAVAFTPAAAQAAPTVQSLKRELRTVKKSRAKWKARAAKADRQRDAAELVASDLKVTNAQLLLATKGNVAAAVWSIARTENAADLQNLVLKPAQNGWPCHGSSFFGQAFFSFDFGLRFTDGSCY